MHHQSNHPFERFIRSKMHALQQAPSEGLWDRIAASQKAAMRKRAFRQLLIRAGIIAGMVACLILGWQHQAGPQAKTKQAALKPMMSKREPKSPGVDSNRNLQQHPGSGSAGLKKYSAIAKTWTSTSTYPPIRPLTSRDLPAKPKNQLTPTASTRNFETTNQAVSLPEEATGFSGFTNPNPSPSAFSSTNTLLLSLPTRFSAIAPLNEAPLPAMAPIIEPRHENRFQYGVSFTVGKLRGPNNQGSEYVSAGLQLQYRLTNRIHLFGGMEWMRGDARFNSGSILGGFPEFPTSQFPHLPPLPPLPPGQSFNLVSDWNGLSMPLGATLYGKLPVPRTEWLVRSYYKPYIALKQKNQLMAPISSSLNDQVFEAPRQQLKVGWIGMQVGIDYRVYRRWRLELTLDAEQALSPVNLEQVNYQAFSLRLAFFRR